MRRRGADLSLGFLMAMVFATLVTMSLAICICKIASPDSLIPFAISEIAAFVGCVIVYVAKEMLRLRA